MNIFKLLGPTLAGSLLLAAPLDAKPDNPYPWERVVADPALATGTTNYLFNDLFLDFYSQGKYASSRPLGAPNLDEVLALDGAHPLECEAALVGGQLKPRFPLLAKPSLHRRFFQFEKSATVNTPLGLLDALTSDRLPAWQSTSFNVDDSSKPLDGWLGVVFEREALSSLDDLQLLRARTHSASVFMFMIRKKDAKGDRYLFEISHSPIRKREEKYGKYFSGKEQIKFYAADSDFEMSYLAEVVGEALASPTTLGSACNRGARIAAYVECR